MTPAVSQANTFQQIISSRNCTITGDAAIEFHRKNDVFQSCQGGNQMIGLKNKTELLAPQLRHLILWKLRDVFTVNQDATGRRPIKAGKQAEQRTFTASG